MQGHFETEEASRQGYSPEEYRELVRRAEQIRAERGERLTSEALAESAAEVGIRAEDLREAERQLRIERRQRARRRTLVRNAGLIVSAVLALFLVFSYNSLNSSRLDAMRARGNLQSALQRRADLVPQLASVVRQGAANERDLLDRLTRARQGLQSGNLDEQLRASRELNVLVESTPQFRSTELYRDLMAQLEGSENRINVARQQYNEAATRYNSTAQSFPNNVVRPFFGLPGEIPTFEATVDVSRPPDLGPLR